MTERFHGGLAKKDTIDFSVNLNPLVTRHEVSRVLQRSVDAAMRYPEQRGERLINCIARHHGIKEANIVLGNGSIELLYYLPHVLKPKRAFVLEPTFCEYRYVCASAGIPVQAVLPSSEFRWDLRALSPRLTQGDVVFICNPNNPTGTLFNKKDILALAKSGAYIVIDEAFMDFSTADRSLIREAVTTPNIIVVKSLTKIYSIAGLRAGFCAANADIISKLTSRLPLWNVNGIALQTAEYFLKKKDFLGKTKRVVERERTFLRKGLSRIPGISVFASAANFFLCRMERAEDLISFAEKNGITMRKSTGFSGLDETHFRVAVRSHKDNTALLGVVARYSKRRTSHKERKRT